MKDLQPRIETLTEKKLVGKSLAMTFSHDRTPELWRSFMPARKNIKNSAGTDLYNVQIYHHISKPADFNEHTEFEKWAAIEVSSFDAIPEGMKPYTLAGGLYAVFIYKGMPADFRETFEYIFYQWLPNSAYELDQREHFEILGDKYKNNHPDSEEEVWIPVKRKA